MDFFNKQIRGRMDGANAEDLKLYIELYLEWFEQPSIEKEIS
jgi:hypothetical protein